ncbi:transmembrane prolyl 4-hydroxylase-like [Mya arenaria]|uniref:transmembrane prolyl 4-hydroxylase-like n=1 Tax=Mya arenaria TaxID=6604 RepID=UPI0022E369ED|nr:transmembrane prolyl 4-hydroxylase-like [Mya arenaria]XP_052815680.1 transmembrane prolyl 4-hydroxylase-like [Mya arenaria]XP_052815681.1 transmembrane prolyl 4-hydroxylase-like [Mya arenaria]XP_052815682.1 transmembrane prolyl 4-hydroxylase-like [Mya arenaria]XP_052815683.1 transmembrane prolyl 4-hydroxylase-like [Mya arenaria]XP_052815684.1 transmembrane prolyl 4-hydroxylase-like [Mya arenaria]XP_052815685.1 transmembrane prolyl 4-hydroxylase-like [Mya arenaria]XP_052815687.1 transmembr
MMSPIKVLLALIVTLLLSGAFVTCLEEEKCTDSSCGEIDEDVIDIPLEHEKRKYFREGQEEVINDEDFVDIIDENEEEELQFVKKDTIELSTEDLYLRIPDNERGELNDIEGEVVNAVRDTFEFSPLARVSPGTVGEEVKVELEEGVWFTRITRAIQPPVFEIPNFLSDEECDHIMETAKANGLNVSNLFGDDVLDEFENKIPLAEVSRVSQQTWLEEQHIGGKFWNRLQNKLAKLTELPLGVIQRGEPIQVVSYTAGGHYHAHLDSVDDYDKPCCFQTRCGDKENTPQWSECCRLCRYMTVLYYLSDTEDGGETAFPIADANDSFVEEKFENLEDQDWYNLSYYCYNSSLVVKPKRGTAIMWYNHFVDEETGYLGLTDRRSHHGGCDLRKGMKWIANNWISGTTVDDRFKSSVFYDGP